MTPLIMVPPYLVQAEHQWDETGTTVTLLAAECGVDNAYYFPADDTVVMCSELFDRPALARWVLHHEMGHAFMDQHGIPNSERGADELAVLMASQAETYAAAGWFLDMYLEDPTHNPNDPHQSDLDRAGALLCLADGVFEEGAARECRLYAESVAENWARMVLMVP